LQAIAIRQYDRWKLYKSDNHNLAGLFAWETVVIEQYFGDCHSVLIGATGGGREAIALARNGVEVTAFDCQPKLVEAAEALLRAEGLEAQFTIADPDQVPEGLGIYDGLILGWGAYIHIIGKENRVRFLRQFREHIEVGSPLLLSFFVRKADSRKMRFIQSIANTIRRLRRSDERVELGDTLNGTFDHYFSEEEIRNELHAAGFAVEIFEDSPFGHAVGCAV
jgi:hypothetical protein